MKFSWVKRSDLQIAPHDAGGWIVKDPLTLQYAHLEDTEYQILNLLDGRRQVSELVVAVKRICPSAGLTAEDFAQFIRTLASHQLIRQTGGEEGTRPSQPRATSWFERMLRAGLSVLRLRIKLLNPTPVIDSLIPFAVPLFQPLVIRCCVSLMVAATAMVVLRFGEVTRQLPSMSQFLGPQNLAALLVIFVVVKLLHEAGHAFTARYFGAECNECGVMLIVFTPVLYTNVTDSWLLPRRQRMLITVAGLFVELTIAAVCTLLWWNAEPGPMRFLLLNTMLVCSANTLLFNGNPLLRFDGYYLLTDWLGIPNLAQQSSATVQAAVLKLLTGRSVIQQPNGYRRWQLLAYGILSSLYRMLLTLVILQLIDSLAAEWRVQFLGAALSLAILVGFIGVPVLLFVMQVRGVVKDAAQHNGNPAGTRLRIVACCILIVGGLLIPLPQSVVAPAFVQPTSQPVFTPLPGQLQTSIRYGDRLQASQPVATLSNNELNQRAMELTAAVNDLQLQLNALRSDPEKASSEILPQVRESLSTAEQRERQFRTELHKLTVAAPTSGVLLPPPRVPAQLDDRLPQLWHGNPLDPENSAAWLPRGTLLGYAGDRRDVRLLIAVGEDKVQLLESGQRFDFLSSGSATTSTSGKLQSVVSLPSEELPVSFAIAGFVNGRAEADVVRPADVTYSASGQLNLVDSRPPPALYSTGRVRIEVQSASLLQRLLRYLRQTF